MSSQIEGGVVIHVCDGTMGLPLTGALWILGSM